MSTDKPQSGIELELNRKVAKKSKGYYLPVTVIDFIKSEAERLTTPDSPVSENAVLVAIVKCYQNVATIDGDEFSAAYEVAKPKKRNKKS